ncbi:MAG TPA: filamentous hemagglutinin N-terminal domain-containing protein [Leptolyngbyaceae cyanobacterium]
MLEYPGRNKWFLAGSLTLVELAIASGFSNSVNRAYAQIIPDTTLGQENSQVIPNPASQGEANYLIEGGATRGNSLFHSFSQFNVLDGQQVYFSPAAGIESIISRVTGSSASNILGTLGVEGGANLYLLNPNGVIFGENARLDIGGAFVVSTADRFELAGGNSFSATDPKPLPNLALSITPGLQYGTTPIGNIQNNAVLSLAPHQHVLLLGNDTLHSGQITAPGGFVELLGNRVALLDNALIDVSGETGGTVLVGGGFQGQGTVPRAQAAFISPDAQISANGSVGNGGLIVVWSDTSTRAYGTFSVQGGPNAGNGGTVETSSLGFLDVTGATVQANAPNGNAGLWLIDPYNVTLTYGGNTNGGFSGGNPDIFTPTASDAVVDIPTIKNQLDAGTNVTITTGSTGAQAGNITGSGFDITKTAGGDATLTLQAANDISLQFFGINSSSNALNLVFQADSDGNGTGNIQISNAGISVNGGFINFTAASSISISDFSLSNSSGGAVDIGDITLKANSIGISRGGITSNTSGAGNAGSILIDANQLSLEGEVTSNTSAVGDTGRIVIDADQLLLTGTIKSDASAEGSIRGIEINADEIITSGLIKTNNLGTGDAGSIQITADQFNMNGGSIESNTSSEGNSSGISITADSVSVQSTGISSRSSGSGEAGLIEINANQLNINQAGINSELTASGNGNGIAITANSITLEQSGINSRTSGAGDAGPVQIQTDSLVAIASGVGGATQGQGDAPDVTITANSVNLSNAAGISSETEAEGAGGTVQLNVGSLVATGDSGIGVGTAGSGSAGTLLINADEIILENAGIGSNAESGSTGNAGTIDIKTNRLTVDGGGISSNAESGSTGSAGLIRIEATDEINVINQSGISSQTNGLGDAGDIFITTGQLQLDDQSALITAANQPNSGAGGDIFITADTLSLTGNSAINSETFSDQDAGLIQIDVTDTVYLSGNSDIFSNTFGSGNAVGVDLSARSVLFENDSGLGSATNGSGNAGKLSITADTTEFRNNSGISTNTRIDADIVTGPFGGTGNAGEISIMGGSLLVSNGGGLVSSSDGGIGGTAGKITIQVDQLTLQDALISTNTDSASNAGAIDITTRDLTLENARISSSTTSTGAAGSVIVRQADQISLTNSTIATTATFPGSTAGSVILSGNYLVANNSDITASSPQGQAGDLDLTLTTLRLNNSQLLAETGLELGFQGADINLQGLNLLFMENGSLISAEAFDNATGGNIRINMPDGFVIAAAGQDSDIVANAFFGRGGNIDITALGIYNFELGRAVPGNGSNSIDASSRFGTNGVVSINDPIVDPSRARTELADAPVDASSLIDRACTADSGQGQSTFVVTGRGGLPPNPTEIVRSNSGALADLGSPAQAAISTGGLAPQVQVSEAPLAQIVEAQTWYRDANGNAVLASGDRAQSNHADLLAANCP